MAKVQKKEIKTSTSSVFTLEGLKDFIGFFDKVNISEVEISEGDKSITLSKHGRAVQQVSQQQMQSAPVMVQQPVQMQQAAPAQAPAPAAQTQAAPAPAAAPAPSNLIEIKSPIVGTFYASSDPKLPPFVTVGADVAIGKTVCVIEAMKVFNEIKAEVAGVVKEVCVKNEQPVEFGQVLFRLEAK
ncbi:MAG: acetyl-CoA carboxylase biotin carboxyl carrier protein [Fibrobacteres bacterium]|nr:acetyl-CoA carboxylase biotin carboxyl carrier protein [Fibrobacterota bacterium]